MEGEINNFIMVWILASATLCYCHTIGTLTLPLNLTSVHLGSPTSFFLGWLSTFKLLLFAFSKGPLSSHPPLSLPHFISLASLPIKFQSQKQKSQNNENPQISQKSLIIYFSLAFIVVAVYLIPLFGDRDDSMGRGEGSAGHEFKEGEGGGVAIQTPPPPLHGSDRTFASTANPARSSAGLRLPCSGELRPGAGRRGGQAAATEQI